VTIRWIENVSRDSVRNGFHYDCGENSMLIQISDPPGDHPKPKYAFKEVYGFDFLDAEDADGFDEDFKINDEQAAELVRLLQRALDNSMNVVVHCHAGICRSGAVVEVATMMGFTPTDRFRQPNLRVKHKMMKVLGWTYDQDEPKTSVGGWLSDGGVWLPDNFEGDV
jgi:rhodanese-related sulfurtransferase